MVAATKEDVNEVRKDIVKLDKRLYRLEILLVVQLIPALKSLMS